ncbi:SMP-30/Gluconolaconase/LRE-like region [Rubripirellula amarantea]|uniref:SMP-30/Gluconolaconase/LRE-like region n=1 Tax=Rubripirellula amarantea TaxID=2527999 RepID=A0A5C5WX67_9BACT|nr:SMP-30/gluconolactonase/LRE family protein [Rubripirellula amarantea]TWT55160.1 SMP-30/Gluconolaconase/LRE-like region [Rubripirellula amarantea]
MPQILQAQPLGFPDTDDLRFLPEGPIPLGDGRFSWVGIQHGSEAKTGSLNVFDLATKKNQRYDLPGRPGFAFPIAGTTKFIVGLERSLGYFNTADQSWEVIVDGIDQDVTNTIINDGVMIGDNVVFGCKDLEFATKKAGLYFFRGRDKELITLRNDQICSNGKAVIQRDDELVLFDIDSPTRTIVQYTLDIDAGTLSEPTVVLDLTDDPAVPDGMVLTPDQSGFIVAMFHPGDVQDGETRWYDRASGELRCVWQTAKSRQNTCPALVPVGDRLKLVITTAVENMSGADVEKCPNAGQIFVGETQW